MIVCKRFSIQYFRRRYIMIQKIRNLIVVVAVSAIIFVPAVQSFAKTPEQRISGSINILREMRAQEDAEAMSRIIKRAKGIAIFPSVVKAGLVIGGQYGEGLLLKRDPSNGTWYGPSFLKIAGASWGLQIGAQSVALVLVINNERGMEQFLKGDQFKLGGEIGIAAGPVGRQGGAATDIQLKASIYSYSMSKGLFAGLTIEGSELDVDENANNVYWGGPVSPRSALKKRASSSRIKPLIREIERLIAIAD